MKVLSWTMTKRKVKNKILVTHVITLEIGKS